MRRRQHFPSTDSHRDAAWLGAEAEHLSEAELPASPTASAGAHPGVAAAHDEHAEFRVVVHVPDVAMHHQDHHHHHHPSEQALLSPPPPHTHGDHHATSPPCSSVAAISPAIAVSSATDSGRAPSLSRVRQQVFSPYTLGLLLTGCSLALLSQHMANMGMIMNQVPVIDNDVCAG